MEDVSVHKLVGNVQMLRDDAVLAFPAFAGVELPTAVGASVPRVAELVDQLLVAEVAQLDGPGDGLTQEVTFVLRFGRGGAGGAPVVVVIIVPGVLVQAGAPGAPRVLQTQV